MPPGVRQGRRIAIGAAIIAALAAAAILIFFLNSIARATRDTYPIVGLFFEAPRLRIGSKVWVAGYPVGEVTRIELLPPTGDSIPPFAATLVLPVRLRSEIRRDSKIRLTRQRLMGEPVVDLTPGTLSAPVLQPGDTLRAPPPLRTAALIEMVGTLRGAIDSLTAEEQALLRRSRPLTSLAAPIMRDLAGIRAELLAFDRRLRAGPLPEFLADTSWRAALDRIVGQVREIDESIRARAATLNDSLYRAEFEQLARRARALQREIDELRALLEEPRGFPGRLEEDPALRNAIATTRAQLDSLIELTRRKPWRYFF